MPGVIHQSTKPLTSVFSPAIPYMFTDTLGDIVNTNGVGISMKYHIWYYIVIMTGLHQSAISENLVRQSADSVRFSTFAD